MAGLLLLRHLISGEYGPLDRLLEFLVFALILYEVIAGVVRERRHDKRQKFLNQRRDFVAGFLESARELKSSLPGPDGASPFTTEYHVASRAWVEKVKAWSSSTAEALTKRSARAGSAFTNVGNSTGAACVAWLPDGRMWCVHEDIAPHFRLLSKQIDNLQKIIENPDAYF